MFGRGDQRRWKKYFNPRTRVGCDLVKHSDCQVRQNFNPRTRVGCDDIERKRERELAISIHAPVLGAI